MSKNRFTIVGEEWISYYGGDAQIVSNGTFEFRVWEREEDAQKVCDLLNEQQDIISEQKEKVARVLNEYSRQFKRHSKEFSFMLDLAEDLGVKSLEAKDD